MKFSLMTTLAAGLAAGLATSALASGPVTVYEPPIVPFVPATYDWSGFYAGLHVGTLLDNNNWAERSGPVANTPGDWGGTPWGLTAGYNMQSGAMVYGAAFDYTGGTLTANSTTGGGFFCVGGTCTTTVENGFAIRGRIGRAFDRTLIYATAGLASGDATGFAGVTTGQDRLTGWTAGIGIEHAVSDVVSLNLEYLYTDLGRLELPTACGVNCYTDVNYGTVRLGVNFNF
ncbi:outer membrane protein [Pararhodobacter sp.]|uniref:outer membrane protein n=1 Tax=Pararhodobacter sp. TaxID=2127056 RepID=UPI002AFEAB92|nr:outer membrane beta-barrel protein [Pararhodobacter sp.]